MGIDERIKTTSQLNAESLELLFSDQVTALRIPSFYESLYCQRLESWVLGHPELKACPHELRKGEEVEYVHLGVDSIGLSYNTVYSTPPEDRLKLPYYQQALRRTQELRAACYPYHSPLDLVRLELDEKWSSGAEIGNFDGQKMMGGILRVMTPTLSHLVSEQPHFDSVPETSKKLVAQFSANIYISVPKMGGELELWSVPPLPLSSIEHLEKKNWREELPASLMIKPSRGDLILFNTRRPHAIAGFSEGVRVTAQCFIGMDTDRKLHLWA